MSTEEYRELAYIALQSPVAVRMIALLDSYIQTSRHDTAVEFWDSMGGYNYSKCQHVYTALGEALTLDDIKQNDMVRMYQKVGKVAMATALASLLQHLAAY